MRNRVPYGDQVGRLGDRNQQPDVAGVNADHAVQLCTERCKRGTDQRFIELFGGFPRPA